MFERIKMMIIKEFIQSFRNPRMRFFLIMPPILQIFLFGYVATMDIRNISTALVDFDRSSESRELMRRLEASGYFTVSHRPDSQVEIRDLLDRGKVLCAIQINSGFARNIRKGTPAQIQIIVDGSDSNTAMIARSYLDSVAIKFSRDMAVQPLIVLSSTIEFRSRVWYNPDLRSRNFYIPGVIALIIMLACLLLTSMAIVREREIGTMEQLMVTPLKPIELMLGKTIPPALIGFCDMLLVTVLGGFWFDVPIKGNFFFLCFSTVVFLLSILGIGIYISTISKTQQQAMMATFFFFQPAILLSGFATPIENMPAFFQYVTYLNPLRYFLIIVRGIFLKGVGIEILWPQIAALLFLGVTIMMISVLKFQKHL